MLFVINSFNMTEWKEYKLEEVIDKFIDYRGKTPSKTSFGIPLITAKIIKNGRLLEPNEFIAEKAYESWMTRGFPEINDVVLTTEAPLGEVALIKNKTVALGQRIITLQTKKELCDSVFLKYYLQSKDGQGLLQARAQGSTVEGIKSADLKKMDISLPILTEQIQIAAILSSLDDKIDLLHRQNKTLEQLAEIIFRQWFVEDVEGIKSSNLEDWILFDPRERIDKQKKYQMFEMKCLSNTDMSISDGVIRAVSSATTFRNGDTLLAKITPCLENGKTGFVMHLNENEIARGSTEFIVLRTKGQASPYWVYCLARSKDFHDTAVLSMTGTSGRQRVHVDILRSYEVKVNIERMRKFHNSVDPYFQRIKSNQNQIRTLTQLNDTLLPKLMSGEVMFK